MGKSSKKTKEPSMDEDIAEYPVYIQHFGRLVPCRSITNVNCYDHYEYELHHFVEKQIRKNSPKRYKQLEHLEKLILLSKNYRLRSNPNIVVNLHKSLPHWSDEKCLKETGLHKYELMYCDDYDYESGKWYAESYLKR